MVETPAPGDYPAGENVISDSTKVDQTDANRAASEDRPPPPIQVEEVLPQRAGSNKSDASSEGTPPPLPPRPKALQSLDDRPKSSSGSLRLPPASSRPKATTALCLGDIRSHTDASQNIRPNPSPRQISLASLGFGTSRSGSDMGDSASVRSYGPTLEAGGDIESLLDEATEDREDSWRTLSQELEHENYEETLFAEDPHFAESFGREFNELEEINAGGSNEEAVIKQWRSKLKHFLILSSAGKPIYSRHGDDNLIVNYIGIIQTIISFYQGADDVLKSFTAGDARFVVMSKGPLNLVTISRLGESDSQLRTQLEALYMQILSTLTLPSLERIFSNRPSTDLRRPLQGTEPLLSALADGFTRGSPSSLLSALECLRLRKSHRHIINNTLLRTRCQSLLYGLIVAGGRLVSVVRPKKHSLHPGDLHLIFNMLFEAGSVKAGGGENWIPLCLPGFNNTGYVYMYVNFLSVSKTDEQIIERPSNSSASEDEIAIIFISANKEDFFELRQMKDDLVEQLEKNGGLDSIRASINQGRLSCTDIIPGTVIYHFLYKSRGNVQFIMPSFEPHFSTPLMRRRLMNLYSTLHSHLHNRPTHLKIHHTTSTTNTSLAWSTTMFELYAIAPRRTSRAALAQAANKVIQWVRREEERIFIIGGAVF